MNRDKYIEDLKDIKDIMNRSSRFISLSGMSGVIAGIFALIGAYFANQAIFQNQDYQVYEQAVISAENLRTLLLIGLTTLILSVAVGIFLTTRQAKKQHQKIWDHQSKRLIINLAIPLVAGGILCMILLIKGYIGFIAPLTLIFYGLALVNASKYTLSEIRSLGLIEIVLGLTASHFIGNGLVFWAAGFGVMHIAYGVLMHIRDKS